MTDQKNETPVSTNDAFDVSRIITQLKIWGERLLDLTKRNPLLGINRSKVSKLLVKTFDTASLFKMLVIDEVAIKMPLILIKKGKKKQDGAQLKIEELEGPENEPDFVVYPGDVDFEAEPKTLHRLLKRIYDNGRSTVEERGVTTLHLTFGVLNWDDPILGESSSPLLLVPCQLESYGPNSHMRLKMLDEELQVNPALEFYLRKKHHIDLPIFSEDKEPTIESLKLFFSQVQACISEQRWRVEDKSWLSTFTFESLVIYKDLQAMAEIAQENPLIAALANARTLSEGSEALGDELDNLDVPATVPIPVMPADASQLEALTFAQSGKHLVIKGPPGTGKSQTISNLIADALGKGKKVLFVSAKMAALNVVHDRLSRLGLGRFCLEAHSTKAGKLKIIEELKRTLEMPFNGSGTLLEEQLEELKKTKIQLNNYVKEIHLPREPLGKTIYQANGKLEKLHSLPFLEFDLPWSDVTSVNREQLSEKIEAIESLAVQSNIFDKKSSHPWRGFVVNTEQPASSELIKKNLQIIENNFDDIKNSFGKLTDILIPVESEFQLTELRALCEALNSLVETEKLPKGWISKTEEELKDLEDLFESAVVKSEEYQSLRKEYKKVTSLSTKELLNLLSPIKEQFVSWTRVINPKFWQWKSSIRPKFILNVDTSYFALCSYLKMATALEAIDAWFNANSKTLTKYVSEPNLNSKLLRDEIVHFRTARVLQLAISQNILTKPKKEILNISPEYHRNISRILEIIKNEDFESAIVLIELNWLNGFVEGKKIESSLLSLVSTRCKEVLTSIQKMHEWMVLQSLVLKCENVGLSNFLLAAEEIGVKDAPEIFEKRFYSQWIETFLNANPALLEFTGSLREEKINQFRDLDRKLRVSMLKRIQYKASEPARSVVGAQNNLGNGGEVGILRKELQKRKRIKPLRKLLMKSRLSYQLSNLAC